MKEEKDDDNLFEIGDLIPFDDPNSEPLKELYPYIEDIMSADAVMFQKRFLKQYETSSTIDINPLYKVEQPIPTLNKIPRKYIGEEISDEEEVDIFENVDICENV